LSLDGHYLEVSDRRFERDGVRYITYRSAAIARRHDMLLVVPPGAAENVPLVVLLHGVQGSAWAWAFEGGAHETIARLVDEGEVPPLALVLPSDGLWGDGSGYLAQPHGPDHEQLILDVPRIARLVDERITETSPIFVAGYSMGGYGALRLGAKHPAVYRAVSAHSSITSLAELQEFVGDDISGVIADSDDASVLYWMTRNATRLPPVRFDCGVDDRLIEPNRALHEALRSQDIAHSFDEFPGGHDWDYWRTHLADSLRFFAGRLGY